MQSTNKYYKRHIWEEYIVQNLKELMSEHIAYRTVDFV